MNILKIGDYIRYEHDSDIGEVVRLTEWGDETDVQIHWLKYNDGMGYQYESFILGNPLDFTIIHCNSDQERLAIKLKYL